MATAITRQHCGNFGPPLLNRRDMLRRAGAGFGGLAFAALWYEEERRRLQAAEQRTGATMSAENAGMRRANRTGGRAKNVIFLFMGGGPSQVDTFDPKPELEKLGGKGVPESIAKGIPKIPRAHLTNVYASPFKFKQYGQSGLAVSDMFPLTAHHADELCVLRSMMHDSPIHTPAEYIATTGSSIGNRPSLGSWVTYGLGSENNDLPGFVVLVSGWSNDSKRPGWSAGFLPAQYQGTEVELQTGIPHLRLPDGVSNADRRAQLDFVARLNRLHQERHAAVDELEARIRSYELAFRMQAAAPGALDLAGETKETLALYGALDEPTAAFGKQCLLARRLVERGVRFVQLRLGDWDAHGNLLKNHTEMAAKSDRPIAALLRDLKRRGLLDETLVIWGGEFGRTPTAENGGKTPGRDHSPSGYTMWLAGGGVRGGQAIGATDALGFVAVEEPIHPNDLHATVLAALGIDQDELFFDHHGRREIATVNGGRVIARVFA
jgi:hypothetical protein